MTLSYRNTHSNEPSDRNSLLCADVVLTLETQSLFPLDQMAPVYSDTNILYV